MRLCKKSHNAYLNCIELRCQGRIAVGLLNNTMVFERWAQCRLYIAE